MNNPTTIRTIEDHKNISFFGCFPHLSIGWIPNQEYVVYATANIPAYTLLCEYVGKIQPCTKLEHFMTYDDLFSLLSRDSKKYQDFILNPHNQSNISRFISGIDSNHPDAKNRRNVRDSSSIS